MRVHIHFNLRFPEHCAVCTQRDYDTHENFFI